MAERVNRIGIEYILLGTVWEFWGSTMAVFWYYLPENITTHANAKCGKLKANCEETAVLELCRQLDQPQLPDGTLLVRWSDDEYSSPLKTENGPKASPRASSTNKALVWKDPVGHCHVMAPSHKYAM